MTEVSYSITRTVNLGNHESVKVHVGLSLTADADIPNDMNFAYLSAKEFVDQRIQEETAKWNE